MIEPLCGPAIGEPVAVAPPCAAPEDEAPEAPDSPADPDPDGEAAPVEEAEGEPVSEGDGLSEEPVDPPVPAPEAVGKADTAVSDGLTEAGSGMSPTAEPEATGEETEISWSSAEPVLTITSAS